MDVAAHTPPAQSDAGPRITPDRAIYDASAALDRLISQLTAFRSGLARLSLPIPAANDRLDHSDDLAAILLSQLQSAAAPINESLDRIQEAEQAAYVAGLELAEAA